MRFVFTDLQTFMKNISLFFFTAALVFAGCSSSDQQGGPGGWGASVTPAVEAVQAAYGSLPLEERLSGIVRAKNQIEVYPRVSAPIEQIFVNSGDYVEKGAALVQLRDVELKERVRQAEANHRISLAREKQAQASLDEVESRIKRIRILAEKNLSSELEIENLEAQLASAEANLELAKAQVEQSMASLEEQRYLLGQTTIRAAISGTLGQRNAEVGMQVSPSTRLFVLGDLEEGIVSVNLTEKMLGYIQEGQKVNIYSELFPDTVLTTELSRISPFLRGTSFSTEAEIEVSNLGNLLIPGMFVTVDVLYGESELATLVPLSAIYQHPRTGVTGIYRASDYGVEVEPATPVENVNEIPLSDPTRMEFVPIQIVAKGRESAGISGLNAGDWVVTIGQNLLIGNENQARVRPVQWKRILDMQQLRAEDLIDQVIVKQNAN